MWETFVDLDILPAYGVIVLRDLDLVFQGQQIYVNISETVRASAKLHRTTFKDLDIYQRMIPLRKFYLIPFTYFFKVKN